MSLGIGRLMLRKPGSLVVGKEDGGGVTRELQGQAGWSWSGHGTWSIKLGEGGAILIVQASVHPAQCSFP
jgi:hypothetical protein